jgi:hypothetical protein
MRKILFITLLFVLSAHTLFAANIYVRDGASGSGTSWSDAYDELSSAEAAAVRGDIIYIAGGTYSGVTFNVAASGTTYIYVKKATSSDHGTETGWDSAYGDGTATISPSTISTDYWDFDGVYGSLDGTFGIEFYRSSGDGKCLTISDGVDHVTLSYIEMENTGYSSSAWTNADCFYLNGSQE